MSNSKTVEYYVSKFINLKEKVNAGSLSHKLALIGLSMLVPDFHDPVEDEFLEKILQRSKEESEKEEEANELIHNGIPRRYDP